MSTISYKKIFTIKITHDYFSGSIDEEGITLFPGLITETLRKRFDIQINNAEDVYSVYINSESSTVEFLSDIESATSNDYLDFNIVVNDSKFYHYTNIPVDSNVSYLYESNASENSLNTNSVLLNPKANTVILNNIFGEVKIYFQDIINNPSEEHIFLIALKSRATFWKYYIINKTQIHLTSPFIRGNIDVSFEGPKQVTMQNDQQALEFTAKQPLKLSKSPKYHFDLLDTTLHNGSSRTKNIFVGLPNPDPTTIEIINKDEDQKVFSLMYIYV